MTTETKQTKAASENIFDIFVNGCRKGWNLATQNLVPNILMAYVIAYILNILGVMDFLNQWLGPVMNLSAFPANRFSSFSPPGSPAPPVSAWRLPYTAPAF